MLGKDLRTRGSRVAPNNDPLTIPCRVSRPSLPRGISCSLCACGNVNCIMSSAFRRCDEDSAVRNKCEAWHKRGAGHIGPDSRDIALSRCFRRIFWSGKRVEVIPRFERQAEACGASSCHIMLPAFSYVMSRHSKEGSNKTECLVRLLRYTTMHLTPR